jgi:RND family efflux transporter MFP subunit
MKRYAAVLLAPVLVLGACSHQEKTAEKSSGERVQGSLYTVHAASTSDVMRAPAVAEPYATATVSTKLMGAVTAVHVREGDMVRTGQPLVSIDARDLTARSAQIDAGIAEAEAMEREAATHLQRMRALFAEDAAPRAQLDAAETSYARAQAAVRAARAGSAELDATRGYSVIRAPFSGVITRRMIDVGAFAAPGAPLITLQDGRRLRVTGTAAPQAVGGLRRGARVDVDIEGERTSGVVEAVVPGAGNLYRVNVIVDNSAGAYLPGSAATLALPQQHDRLAIRVPAAAIQQKGDLTGVYVKSGETTMLRWVQLGVSVGEEVEVLTGLRDGEQIVIPASTVRGVE